MIQRTGDGGGGESGTGWLRWKYNCFCGFSLFINSQCMNTHTFTHTHTHPHKEDARQHGGSSKLHRGNYASTDALLLRCQPMVTAHLEWFFLLRGHLVGQYVFVCVHVGKLTGR